MISLTKTPFMLPPVVNPPESWAPWTIIKHPFLSFNNPIHCVPCLYVVTGFLQPVFFFLLCLCRILPQKYPPPLHSRNPELKVGRVSIFSPACWLMSGFCLWNTTHHFVSIKQENFAEMHVNFSNSLFPSCSDSKFRFLRERIWDAQLGSVGYYLRGHVM